MINYNNLLKEDIFGIKQSDKKIFFYENLKKLNSHHRKNCKEFDVIAKSFFSKNPKKLEDLPFLHVKLFKVKELISVKREIQTRTFTSSGTSSLAVSKINIDRYTSLIQSKVLYQILMSVLKKKTKKIFFIDSEKKIKELYFNARGAAINGFRQIAEKSEFILDDNEKIDFKKIDKINPKDEYVFFSFTNILWEKFLRNMIIKKKNYNFKNSILFHGGGWKKLESNKIEKKIFYGLLTKHLNINKIFDYYGMIEQTGSIFLECEYGYYHPSIFSEINIRNNNLKICGINQKGLIQVSSLLPLSYPGHNILTEDLGELKGFDNCKCGRKGKYFKIHGRLPNSEVKGCANV